MINNELQKILCGKVTFREGKLYETGEGKVGRGFC